MQFYHHSVIVRILAMLIRKKMILIEFLLSVMAFITDVCSLQAKNCM